MANYKHPNDRASETVTFRLTLDERRLFDHLAKRDKKSRTDLLRHLLIARAEQLGIDELPAAPRTKRPGRQKERPDMSLPATEPATPIVRATVDSVAPRGQGLVFSDLIERFRVHFADRAEGTRKELEETIRFLSIGEEGAPLLPLDLYLRDLTSSKLRDVRNAMTRMNLRVAKMNLHLTYLRMMLHWAVKQPDIGLSVNPGLDLKSFTVSEVPNSWPGRRLD
ncbi:MAG: hypothetical protein GY854_25850 [Deltaproteobacteria bacterium]|nr:hypothetical protein [Deltaproteobacteria bacterium]